MAEPLAKKYGYCPVCEKTTSFNIWGPNLRDTYLCGMCGSNPRQRALSFVLTKNYPEWRAMKIHESSPGDTALSNKLAMECSGYISSQYDTSFSFGDLHKDGWQNENLEQQTFDNECFDIVITQDVFEHIFHPDRAIQEIARTLKPGGCHICTVPLVMNTGKSIRRASIDDHGNIKYLEEPEYHSNPIDKNGSLVTIWWGYDISSYFNTKEPSLSTMIFANTISDYGIEGPLTEVVFSCKMKPSDI